MLIDTHAHLEAVDDLEDSLKRAKEAGVGKIITIGTSLASSKKAIEIADPPSHKASEGQENIPEIYATVGIHPKDGKSEVEKFGLHQCIDTLKQLAVSSDEVVGIGEAGLDYRLTADNEQLTADKEKGFQKKLFTEQIKLAADLNLPLVIHCRNAWDDLLSLLTTDYGLPTPPGVFHSFTGNWQAAQKALDLGFYISFSGIVTFKNASEIQEVAKKIPLDRILIETDSPFLTPEPIRSGPPKLTSRLSSTVRTRLEERNRRVNKQNEPRNVKIVAQFLAHLRNQPINTIIGASADNAKRLFGI